MADLQERSNADALRSWLAGLPPLTGAGSAAGAARQLVDTGFLQAVPLPGSGLTAERFGILARLGAVDCTLARLIEGHLDAVAILRELEGPEPEAGRLWGVWAAQPPGVPPLRAAESAASWRLDGPKPYSSGAGLCDDALVTAESEGAFRLFAVPVAAPAVEPVEGTWPAIGMAGSDSRMVSFREAPAQTVGSPGAYVQRPGFWQGGVGVAACWYGAATGVAQSLLKAAGARELDPHAMAHLGAIDSALQGARATLQQAAAVIDSDPMDERGNGELLARRCRAVVEEAAQEVMERTGRALGAGPLTQDLIHARRVADLTVYLRQSHAERDLARLGKLVAKGPGEVGLDPSASDGGADWEL